jgi:hypothetical protein
LGSAEIVLFEGKHKFCVPKPRMAACGFSLAGDWNDLGFSRDDEVEAVDLAVGEALDEILEGGGFDKGE